jgi:hypothetical protein
MAVEIRCSCVTLGKVTKIYLSAEDEKYLPK